MMEDPTVQDAQLSVEPEEVSEELSDLGGIETEEEKEMVETRVELSNRSPTVHSNTTSTIEKLKSVTHSVLENCMTKLKQTREQFQLPETPTVDTVDPVGEDEVKVTVNNNHFVFNTTDIEYSNLCDFYSVTNPADLETQSVVKVPYKGLAIPTNLSPVGQFRYKLYKYGVKLNRTATTISTNPPNVVKASIMAVILHFQIVAQLFIGSFHPIVTPLTLLTLYYTRPLILSTVSGFLHLVADILKFSSQNDVTIKSRTYATKLKYQD